MHATPRVRTFKVGRRHLITGSALAELIIQLEHPDLGSTELRAKALEFAQKLNLKASYSIDEAADAVGVSRRKFYEFVTTEAVERGAA